MDILNLGLGLVGLIAGAEFAVRGSLGLARRWGWPDWLAGMVLLALGTSLPELFVSLAAAPTHPLVSLGNVFGSNAFNSLLIIGSVLLASRGAGIPLPSKRHPGTQTTMIAALLLAVVIYFYNATAEMAGGPYPIHWAFGLALLITYARVLYVALRRGIASPESSEQGGGRNSALLTLLGFALLAFSSGKFLDGALGIAEQMGWNDGLVGYIIAAIGTSAPELVTCLRALRRGSPELIFGNLLGSNAFNLLIVAGASIVVSGNVLVDFNTTAQAGINFVACLLMMWMWSFRGLGRPRINPILGLPLLLLYLLSAWLLN